MEPKYLRLEVIIHPLLIIRRLVSQDPWGEMRLKHVTHDQGLPQSPETTLKNRRNPTSPRDLLPVNL